MGKTAVAIGLSEVERQDLESLVRAQKTRQATARRARIVLAAVSRMENRTTCAAVGAETNTVGNECGG